VLPLVELVETRGCLNPGRCQRRAQPDGFKKVFWIRPYLAPARPL